MITKFSVERDGQQRLPAALPADRRAGARRRRRRRAPRSSRWSAPTGCAAWSPPTSTGTTTARCPRWSRPPAPRRSPGAEDADELPVPVDRRVGDGDLVEVGDCRLEVIRADRPHPGLDRAAVRRPRRHAAPVHRRLAVPRRRRQDLVGRRLHVPDGRRLDAKLFDRLPDETWFYPGHGDDSTLGDERPHLAEWRERGW